METAKTGFKHNPSNRTIETAGRVYGDTPTRPGNFHQLRQANYGQGSRQATFGEILDLAYSSHINQGNVEADKVIQTAKNNPLSGNTAMRYTPQIRIVQDMPEVRDGRIVMAE